MEWIDMAARLIHWKSSSLLPSDPAIPDPGAALAQEIGRDLKSLSEAQLGAATEFLASRNEELERAWAHSSENDFLEQPPLGEEPFASLWTVRRKAQTLRDTLQKSRQIQAAAYEMGLDATSVEDMRLAALLELEEVEPGVWFSAASWFRKADTSERRISLFLALLELAFSGEVRIDEDTVDYSVRLCRT